MTPVPVQIEACTLPAESALNPLHFPVTGVCGECTRCHKRAERNPATFRGGPKTSRKAAALAVLVALTKACEERLPWGLPPVHADRRIPRGVTLWVVEKATGNRQAVAVNEKGKLETVWCGVALAADVYVVAESDAVAGSASDFAQALADAGYTGVRCGREKTPRVGKEKAPRKKKEKA